MSIMHKPSAELFTIIRLSIQASINQHKKEKKFLTDMSILNLIKKVRKESQEKTSISVNTKQKVLHNTSLYAS